MKNVPAIAIAVILMFAAAIYLSVNRTRSGSVTPPPPAVVDQPTTTISGEPTPTGTTTVATFNIQAQNFTFDIKEIKVKLNDKVTINFTNNEGTHDWNLDEFNAHTQKIAVGQTESITFTADKQGTFEYYCSVGNHRAMGMVGKLVVE